jgi:hypothetical protein
MLLLSTDFAGDLSARNDNLISFSAELPPLAEKALLEHPNKWFVGSRQGCSCGFRHLYISSVVLGFGEPEDWFPEDPEDIEATLRFVAIVRELVGQGAHVDCIDVWGLSTESASIEGTIHVDLSQLDDRAFRFFEDHRFVFVAEPSPAVNPTCTLGG